MRKSLTFGQIWGIPLRIHVNWFFVAALVTWSLAAGYFPQEHPGWKMSAYWVVGIATSILFFGSVLIHELGHALVAQREGVPVNSITLFIFGGVAHIAHEPETAGSEFRIVAAGPLASLVLAGFFYGLGRFFRFSPELGSMALYLGQINIILGLFNLLPGFPLDGGRILRAIFWKLKRDFLQATRWATNASLVIALAIMAGGILLMLLGHYFTGLWVAFIGWYLSISSRASYRQTVEEAKAGSVVEEGTVSGETPDQRWMPEWSLPVRRQEPAGIKASLPGIWSATEVVRKSEGER